MQAPTKKKSGKKTKGKGIKAKKRKMPLARSGKKSRDLSDYWVPGLILLLTAIIFYPALSYDFVNWDDDVNVYNNPYLTALSWDNIKAIFSTTVIGNYNPLPILSFALERHFFGLDPQIFHLNNLLLHLVNTYLVYALMRRLGLQTFWAAAVTLLFGIHPMRVESVVWITERKDVLFTVFYLAALIQYSKYLQSKEKHKKHLVWLMIFFVLSLFSKIQAVALPLSMVGLDYLWGKRLSWQLFIRKWPYFALSLVVGLLGIYMLGENESLQDAANLGWFNRIFVGAFSFVVYLIKFVYPYLHSPLYAYPQELHVGYYLAIIPALGYLYLMYIAYKRDQRWLVFGLWFFLANVVFLLQVLAAGQGFIADRFTYVPYIGLWFVMGFGLQKILQQKADWKITIIGGIAIYAFLMAYLSRQTMPIWQNGYELWTHVLTHYPHTSTPYGNRGYWLRDNGRAEEAIADYKKAISIEPNKANFYNSYGRALFDLGRLQEALSNYSKAIELEDDRAEYYSNRAAAYGASDQIQAALKDLNKSLELDPSLTNAYLNRSLVYNQLGDAAKAQQDILWLLNKFPNDANWWFEAAVNYSRLGQLEPALEHFDRSIQLNGSMGIYYLERSRVKHRLGRKQAGIQDARTAQQLGAEVPASLLR